jgi:hypothetical protein
MVDICAQSYYLFFEKFEMLVCSIEIDERRLLSEEGLNPSQAPVNM